MNNPLVSFVVPCYKLAHLLKECVDSILLQSYTNLEVLIMDDLSPDHTAEIASSFQDPRVRHIRNPENLGHLKNYNAGIALSKGDYVWLISADDYLKTAYVLERYISLLEKRQNVGYAFCPGIEVRAGIEGGVLDYSVLLKYDCIIDGQRFLRKLLDHNFIIAASALVRRSCYDDISMFPVSEAMEWCGDWYLWCLFALRYDVAYFAESMVCYRAHELSMTQQLAKAANLHKCSAGDLAIPLMVRRKAEQWGIAGVSKACLKAFAKELVRQNLSKQYQASHWSLSSSKIEELIQTEIPEADAKRFVRAKVCEGMGDRLWKEGQCGSANQYYRRSRSEDPQQFEVYLKIFLVSLGVPRRFFVNLKTRVNALRVV